MMQERKRQIEAVALEALGRTAAERTAYLDAACADDPALRRDVDSLLAGQAEAAALLESPPWTGAPAPPLAPGTRLGPYEIQATLGAGGMGQVYKARDTRLGRTVAVKVLPPMLAGNPERRRRFEREARAVSALQHPHLCPLFDVGEAVPSSEASLAPSAESPAPVHYLVLAYLEGQTLATRLRKGALPLSHVLDLGAQMADALSAAHKAGIVHRDVKPSNVMLTKAPAGEDGASGLHATLLDFGLAKLTGHGERAAIDADWRASGPVQTAPGIVLGTVPYMAPEQVEGKEADARTDMWALGAVLYEMATGRRAFDGETPTLVAAAILEREPAPVAALQPGVPPALVRVVMKCLAKDPDARWSTAHDLADELRWIAENGAAGAVNAPRATLSLMKRTPALAAGAVVLALTAGAAIGWWAARSTEGPTRTVTRASIDVYPAHELSGGDRLTGFHSTPGGYWRALSWAPDGRAIVFAGRVNKARQLYLRRLDAAEARPLAGTDGAQVPAVSPDGQWVAFWSGGVIRKVPLSGGPAMDLTSGVMSVPSSLAWDSSGRIYFDRDDGRIWVIRPDGALEAVTTVHEGELRHRLPRVLPGGRVLLYTVRKRNWSWGDEQIVAQTLATGVRKVLLKDAVDAHYLPSGHLVFLRRGTLYAARFDLDRLEARGAGMAVIDAVVQSSPSGAGQFAVSPTGTLAWVPGSIAAPRDAALVAVSREGRVELLPAPSRSYGPTVRVSPDGRRFAVSIVSVADVGVWLYTRDRGTLAPLARGAEASWPLWAPDGRRLWFWWTKDGSNSLAAQPADGTASPEVILPGEVGPSSWAPGGRHLAAVPPGARRGADILILAFEGERVTVRPWFETPHTEMWPVFSPDGKWLAYGSNRSGRNEIYVKPYPGPGPEEQVSIDGGESPAWNPHGTELYFVDRAHPAGRSSMMAVNLDLRSSVRADRPGVLFEFDPARLLLACAPVRCYDIAPDGRQFYATQVREVAPPPVITHISLIENWFVELKARVRDE